VAYYKNRHKESIPHDKWYGDLDDTGRLALIAARDANAQRVLDSFSRQEARLDRAIKSAVHELRRCRADRRALIDSDVNPDNDDKDPGPIGFALQVDLVEHNSHPIPAPEPPPTLLPDVETARPTGK